MSKLKELASRTERLERRTKGEECNGCTRTAIAELIASMAAIEERSGCADWSSSAPAPCPDCGNPNPQIPLRLIREILSDGEEKEPAEKQEDPDSAPAPKVKAPGEENEQH